MGVQSAVGSAEQGRSTERAMAVEPVALLDQTIEIAIRWDRSAFAASLHELRERLTGDRLQLAVLGQFKRGKSTLLNALIGLDVLPIGVVPVTAIPTFLEGGADLELRIEFEDGHTETHIPDDVPAMRRVLTALVTEEGNPKNLLRVARVLVRAPSPLLGRGVVLIDTPGVGSTLQHNTAAAEMTLPACDAGLFVVSADPPITEAELTYLARVREHASHLLVVLNKADLLAPEDLRKAEAFLQRVLVEQAGLAAPEVFAVSAKHALDAKEAGDQTALCKSGLADLEARLEALLAGERHAILKAAVARKGGGIVRKLRFELGLERKALELPVSDLEQRRTAFAAAIEGFQAERRLVRDLLVTDQKRSLEALEEEAARLRESLGAEIQSELESAPEAMGRVWATLRERLPDRFQRELGAAMSRIREELRATFGERQARTRALVELVQRTAAEMMELPFEGETEISEFEAHFLPYWVIERPDAINPLPPGAFERLLPRPLRRTAERQRIRRELDDIMIRNVENLRWAMRQNILDAFRRFTSEIDALFTASLAATRDVMDAAAARKSGHQSENAERLQSLEVSEGDLGAIEGALANLAS